MTEDRATAEIIELVYHSAVISDDPWVQEVHVAESIKDILEEFRESKTDNEEDLAAELRQAEREIDDLNIDIAELEAQLDEALRDLAAERMGVPV